MANEREEIRHFCPPGTFADEAKLRHSAGSYHYLCSIGGHVTFTHQPIGTVLHVI